MRRAVVALTGVVAGTTLLISLKSAPGASRLPGQVLEDELRAEALLAAASPGPTPTVSPGPTLPGGRSAAPTPGPVPTTTAPRPTQPRPLPSRPPANPQPTGTQPSGGGGPVEGDSALTEFGYVTVAITVANGRITNVTAVELPSGESRSVSLSNYAAPILRQRALQAQGTRFDTVSGATWTSQAYQQSLASAMDKAGLDATR